MLHGVIDRGGYLPAHSGARFGKLALKELKMKTKDWVCTMEPMHKLNIVEAENVESLKGMSLEGEDCNIDPDATENVADASEGLDYPSEYERLELAVEGLDHSWHFPQWACPTTGALDQRSILRIYPSTSSVAIPHDMQGDDQTDAATRGGLLREDGKWEGLSCGCTS